jgi:hypothetical protein
MVCTYQFINIDIILFCAELGSEAYGGRTLDILQCLRMHPEKLPIEIQNLL